MSVDLTPHGTDITARTAYSAFGGASDHTIWEGGPWGCLAKNGIDPNCGGITTGTHVGDDQVTNYIQTSNVLAANPTVDGAMIPANGQVPYTWRYAACHTGDSSTSFISTTFGLRTGAAGSRDNIPKCPTMSETFTHQGTFGAPDFGEAHTIPILIVCYDSTASLKGCDSYQIGKFTFQLDLQPQQATTSVGAGSGGGSSSSLNTITSGIINPSSIISTILASGASATSLAPVPVLTGGTTAQYNSSAISASRPDIVSATRDDRTSPLPTSTIALAVVGSGIALCLMVAGGIFWRRMSQQQKRTSWATTTTDARFGLTPFPRQWTETPTSTPSTVVRSGQATYGGSFGRHTDWGSDLSPPSTQFEESTLPEYAQFRSPPPRYQERLPGP